MAPRTLNITDGPNKPALQRALMLPEVVTAHFQIEGEGLDVTIAKMEEQPDGFSFKLEGRVASGAMKGSNSGRSTASRGVWHHGPREGLGDGRSDFIASIRPKKMDAGRHRLARWVRCRSFDAYSLRLARPFRCSVEHEQR